VLSTKLTLVDHMGARILPARYTDNYLTVLPGETRRVLISYPAKLGGRAAINLRGWNARATSAKVREVAVTEGSPQRPPDTFRPPVKAESAEVKLPRR